MSAPSNDNFANALGLGGSLGSDWSNNVDATTEAGEPASAFGKTIWWRWLCPANGTYTFTTGGNWFGKATEFASVLQAFTGSSVSALTEVSYVENASAGVGYANAATVTFNATAGTTYRLRVSSRDGSSGTAVLSFTSTNPVRLGSCDACATDVDSSRCLATVQPDYVFAGAQFTIQTDGGGHPLFYIVHPNGPIGNPLLNPWVQNIQPYLDGLAGAYVQRTTAGNLELQFNFSDVVPGGAVFQKATYDFSGYTLLPATFAPPRAVFEHMGIKEFMLGNLPAVPGFYVAETCGGAVVPPFTRVWYKSFYVDDLTSATFAPGTCVNSGPLFHQGGQMSFYCFQQTYDQTFFGVPPGQYKYAATKLYSVLAQDFLRLVSSSFSLSAGVWTCTFTVANDSDYDFGVSNSTTINNVPEELVVSLAATGGVSSPSVPQNVIVPKRGTKVVTFTCHATEPFVARLLFTYNLLGVPTTGFDVHVQPVVSAMTNGTTSSTCSGYQNKNYFVLIKNSGPGPTSNLKMSVAQVLPTTGPINMTASVPCGANNPGSCVVSVSTLLFGQTANVSFGVTKQGGATAVRFRLDFFDDAGTYPPLYIDDVI